MPFHTQTSATAPTSRLGGAGLDFITSTTFSAVASVSVDGCFTATYENYLVVFDALAASGSPSVILRMRAASTDASGANYRAQLVYDTYVGAGADSAGSTGATSLFGLGVDSSTNSIAMTFVKPFAAAYTTVHGAFVHGTAAGSAMGRHDVATSYDGFSVINSGTGTITGTLRVYGYRNS